MIAKYPGTCRYCKRPTEADVDTYDPETKANWHEACRESQPPGPESYRLADRLGFVDSGSVESVSWVAVCQDWILRKMLPETLRPPAGRPGSIARGRDTDLFGN